MKWTLRLVGGFVLLLVIGIVVVVMRGGSIIKNAVETYGPDITGGPVSVASVDYSLFDGHANLDGLTIGNPEGFESAYAFRLGQMSIQLDPMSVFSGHVKIQEIRIDEPDLIVEVGRGGTNLRTIQNNVSAYGGGTEDQEEAGSEAEVGVTTTIDHVYITGGKIQVVGPAILGDTPTADLPDIHLEGIGADEDGGTDMGAAVAEIMGAVIPAATQAVANLNLKGIRDELLGEGDSLKDKIGDTIGGLFKRKKDPDN